jgi:hypothetical protein
VANAIRVGLALFVLDVLGVERSSERVKTSYKFVSFSRRMNSAASRARSWPAAADVSLEGTIVDQDTRGKDATWPL